jgi:hypothetical protein
MNFFKMDFHKATVVLLLLPFFFAAPWASAEDTPITRATMANLRGVRVVVEHIQPHLAKYAAKAGLSELQLQKDIEERLRAEGVATLDGEPWLKTPGRPILYVHLNSHEMDRFWFAYDIKLELRQIVFLEADPAVKTMADTWSINITGVANIGNLPIVRNDVRVLVDRFVQACKLAVRRQ